MVNVELLFATIKEKHTNIREIAQAIGVNHSTLYRKLKNGGVGLTICEVEGIAKFLELTGKQINLIFFACFVA